MPVIPTFTSRAGYDAAPVPGQNPGAAGIAANALAEGMARVSGQFAQVWQAQREASDTATALEKFAEYRNAATDLSTRYDNDPDPATAPQRFEADLVKLATTTGEGLAPGPAAYLRRMTVQHGPAAYAQVAHRATARVNQNELGRIGRAQDTFVNQATTAASPVDFDNAVLAIRQGSVGAEAAGLVPAGGGTKMLSHALRQIITTRAATDPVAAQGLLERFKTEMTGDDVTALTTGLRAPLERRQGEDAATASIALSADTTTRARAVEAGFIARGWSPAVARGLAANAVQESGANPAPALGDGGRSSGLFQWNASRRAAFVTRFGVDPHQATLDQQLDFADWELRNTEGRAGDALRGAATAEDAARIASTQFLRPRDTAAEEPRRAAIATRLGGAQGQREAALADVRGRLADAPLHVRLQGESLVAQHFAHQEAQQGQQRAVLGQQLRDLDASYAAGRTDAPIPEDRIRALTPSPEAAQRTIDSLTLARTAGDAVAAVSFASPEEVQAQRARLAGTPGDTYLGAERGQLVERFDAALRERQRLLATDPAGYAAQAPQVRALIEAQAPPGEIATATLAAQARMGVPAWKQRILADSQVQQMAATLRTTGPDKADMAATLAGLQQQFGPQLWNRAYGELVQHGKIGWEWQAIGAMTAPAQAEGRALLQRALVFQAEKGGPEAMKKLVPPDVLKGFDGEVDTALEPLREATRHHPGGDSLFSTMKQAVGTLALYHAWRGMKGAEAATRAYQDVIGARWDTAGDDGSGWLGRTATMLVPKGRAGEIETALDLVRGRLAAADLQPLPDPGNPGASPAQLAEATLGAARRGFWVNNADASGAVLKGRTPGGSIVDLTRADGTRIEVKFDALPTLDRAARDAAELEDGRNAARALRERSR